MKINYNRLKQLGLLLISVYLLSPGCGCGTGSAVLPQHSGVPAESTVLYQLPNHTHVQMMCYVLKTSTGKRIVIASGDLGTEGGQRLLELYGTQLKCDVLQMAHHGSFGVSKRVYAALFPAVCLWPAPDWLYDNDPGSGYNTGPWQTVTVRRWMEDFGAKISYSLITWDGCYSAVPFFGTKNPVKSTLSMRSRRIFLSIPPAYPVRLPPRPTTL